MPASGSWQVDVEGFIFVVALHIATLYERLYTLLDHWRLRLEHRDGRNDFLDKLLMRHLLVSLHDFHDVSIANGLTLGSDSLIDLLVLLGRLGSLTFGCLLWDDC